MIRKTNVSTLMLKSAMGKNNNVYYNIKEFGIIVVIGLEFFFLFSFFCFLNLRGGRFSAPLGGLGVELLSGYAHNHNRT